jgi:GTP cyclohydrolase IA
VSQVNPVSEALAEVCGDLLPSPTQLPKDPEAEATTACDQFSPRPIDDADWLRFRGYMEEIFETFGMQLGTPGTERTPERFLKALYDATAGYEGDSNLLTAFPTECRCDADCLVSQVIEGPISFYSLCEHHALPFHGFVHVGYVAHERSPISPPVKP